MTLAIDIRKISAADRAHLIHPLCYPEDAREPFIWVQGNGATLRSADGREFIDGVSCLWNVNVGHGRKELAQAAARQMDQLAFASSYAGNTNIPAVQLGEKLASICYAGIQRFYFTSGGAESIDSAIKTARFFWNSQGKTEKTKIISRAHSYHGLSLAAMSATGIPAFWPMFGGKLPGFLHIPSPYPYRYVSDDPSVPQGIAAANLLEKTIRAEGPETVAAFIAEPVQGVGGVIVPQDDYFGRIREICNTYDVLFIADEVITGFGRTGRWFGLERYGVEPDILALAKGITSGYLPLGGMGLSERVYRSIAEAPSDRRWMHAATYSGHPTACAVGLANVEIIERENLVEAVAWKGQRLMAGLRQLSTLDCVGEVRGTGLMAGVEFVEDKVTRKPFSPSLKIGERVFEECVSRGLFGRFRGDTFVLAPPFVITEDQIDRTVNILAEAIPTAMKNL